MDVYQIHHPLQEGEVPAGPVVLAMGFFDGVHRGHREVIRRAKEEANRRQVPLAVLTYDKLPGLVYAAIPNGLHYLTTTDRKLELLAGLGVDRVYLVDFTAKLGSLPPQAFVDDYLVAMGAVAVVAGFDHTYGPKDVATMAKLPDYAAGRFDVITVAEESAGDAKVSSTRIRQLIDEGQVAEANQLLATTYQTTGIVVHGFARGRTLGFPTANVAWTWAERLPGVGVYAVRFYVDGEWYGGMASVGYNVTFGDDNQKTVEVYLFDFDANIYGEHVKVEWVRRLRGEVKFAGKDELIAQLKQDEYDARRVLAK